MTESKFVPVELPMPGEIVMVIPKGTEDDPSQWWEARLRSFRAPSERPYVVQSTHPRASGIHSQSVSKIAVKREVAS